MRTSVAHAETALRVFFTRYQRVGFQINNLVGQRKILPVWKHPALVESKGVEVFLLYLSGHEEFLIVMQI